DLQRDRYTSVRRDVPGVRPQATSRRCSKLHPALSSGRMATSQGSEPWGRRAPRRPGPGCTRINHGRSLTRSRATALDCVCALSFFAACWPFCLPSAYCPTANILTLAPLFLSRSRASLAVHLPFGNLLLRLSSPVSSARDGSATW